MYTPLTDRVLEYTRGKISSMHLLLALLSRDQLVISSHVDAARFRYSIIRSMQQEMDIQHLFCDFCSSSQHDVLKLIAGPNTYICNECVEKAEGALQNKIRFEGDVHCSFCGKHANEVDRNMVNSWASDDAWRICLECIVLCRDIVDEEQQSSEQ